MLNYAIENYGKLKFKSISKKYDRDLIEDLYFNQNKSQKEITELISIKKSTLSQIIKSLRKERVVPGAGLEPARSQ